MEQKKVEKRENKMHELRLNLSLILGCACDIDRLHICVWNAFACVWLLLNDDCYCWSESKLKKREHPPWFIRLYAFFIANAALAVFSTLRTFSVWKKCVRSFLFRRFLYSNWLSVRIKNGIGRAMNCRSIWRWVHFI